ncbi:MAG: methylmalonyl-CoA/ethylmalonyl-CoA epimerase [Bacteroidia bacterium]
MIRKIEHLGIAVKSIANSNEILSKLLDTEAYKQESVDSENVMTSFFKLGETKVELLEATSEESAISKFIEKRGEGIHHIALDVVDIEGELQRLKNLGFQLIHEKPKLGADGKKIAFLHPKSTNGILVELCEDINKDNTLETNR